MTRKDKIRNNLNQMDISRGHVCTEGRVSRKILHGHVEWRNDDYTCGHKSSGGAVSMENKTGNTKEEVF